MKCHLIFFLGVIIKGQAIECHRDVEKGCYMLDKRLPYTASGNGNDCSHYRKQYGDGLKKKKKKRTTT